MELEEARTLLGKTLQSIHDGHQPGEGWTSITRVTPALIDAMNPEEFMKLVTAVMLLQDLNEIGSGHYRVSGMSGGFPLKKHIRLYVEDLLVQTAINGINRTPQTK